MGQHTFFSQPNASQNTRSRLLKQAATLRLPRTNPEGCPRTPPQFLSSPQHLPNQKNHHRHQPNDQNATHELRVAVSQRDHAIPPLSTEHRRKRVPQAEAIHDEGEEGPGAHVGGDSPPVLRRAQQTVVSKRHQARDLLLDFAKALPEVFPVFFHLRKRGHDLEMLFRIRSAKLADFLEKKLDGILSQSSPPPDEPNTDDAPEIPVRRVGDPGERAEAGGPGAAELPLMAFL